jgi:hypothetical protein
MHLAKQKIYFSATEPGMQPKYHMPTWRSFETRELCVPFTISKRAIFHSYVSSHSRGEGVMIAHAQGENNVTLEETVLSSESKLL